MRFRPAFRRRDRWNNLLVATSTLAHAVAPSAPVKGNGIAMSINEIDDSADLWHLSLIALSTFANSAYLDIKRM